MTLLIAWFFVGGLIGITASLLDAEDAGRTLLVNVVAGIAAALASAFYVAPRLGMPIGNPWAFALGAIGLSLFGAVAAAWLVTLVRQRSAASN